MCVFMGLPLHTLPSVDICSCSKIALSMAPETSLSSQQIGTRLRGSCVYESVCLHNDHAFTTNSTQNKEDTVRALDRGPLYTFCMVSVGSVLFDSDPQATGLLFRHIISTEAAVSSPPSHFVTWNL